MDPKVLAIFFRDLNKKAQREILKFYNIKSELEDNLDVFPLFILEEPDE